MKFKAYMTQPLSATDTSTMRDDTIGITQFRQMLKEAKGQASFASPTLTKPIAQAPRGYITLLSIFDSQNCYQMDGHPECFVENVNHFIEQYANWEVTISDELGDNTYNYNSPVEDYINMQRITIVNPAAHGYESKDIMFLSAGLDLDPRGAYTKNVMAVFDNDLGEHYDAESFGFMRYDVMDGEFDYHDRHFEFSASATLADESYSINLGLSDDSENFDDAYELTCDGADQDELKETLNDLLDDLYDGHHELTNLKVQYISEAGD